MFYIAFKKTFKVIDINDYEDYVGMCSFYERAVMGHGTGQNFYVGYLYVFMPLGKGFTADDVMEKYPDVVPYVFRRYGAPLERFLYGIRSGKDSQFGQKSECLLEFDLEIL
ncbi:hypothetical protein GCM10023173_04910 [Sphingobacterium thermophilum]|uniref:Uncharacterized protein n=1 Tax=Sphingobacterium thermophilum TaxID=768534 RepID=A0ABP8QWA5_9SPHI